MTSKSIDCLKQIYFKNTEITSEIGVSISIIPIA